ncbi:hypothetical protein K439DRAFT_1642781 [Ramaria rubella]|nr:hypothetical protein K439DRAFT_1642781 [Ramaria rubella]
MFHKFFASLSVISLLVLMVAANGSPTTVSVPTETSVSQCNADNDFAYCCTESSFGILSSFSLLDQDIINLIASLLNIVIPADVGVALNCPTIVGDSCSATAVCCENSGNNDNNVVGLGCGAISL